MVFCTYRKDTVVYCCKGILQLRSGWWEQHIWNSCFFSPSFGGEVVLAASGKKECSSNSSRSICPLPTARKHGFYNRKGTTSSLSYNSKASLRLCQMLPPTNRLRLLLWLVAAKNALNADQVYLFLAPFLPSLSFGLNQTFQYSSGFSVIK